MPALPTITLASDFNAAALRRQSPMGRSTSSNRSTGTASMSSQLLETLEEWTKELSDGRCLRPLEQDLGYNLLVEICTGGTPWNRRPCRSYQVMSWRRHQRALFSVGASRARELLALFGRTREDPARSAMLCHPRPHPNQTWGARTGHAAKESTEHSTFPVRVVATSSSQTRVRIALDHRRCRECPD